MSGRQVTSKYFPKPAEKRTLRNSSASDTASSPELLKTKQEKKKQKQETVCEADKDCGMALQEKLEEINRKLELLSTTQQDIKQIRLDMDKLTSRLTEQVNKLEGDVFNLQTDKDRLNKEVGSLKEENSKLRNQLDQQGKELRNHRLAQNDNEQHGRQWNLRVFGVKEEQQGKTESVSDCVRKCCHLHGQGGRSGDS